MKRQTLNRSYVAERTPLLNPAAWTELMTLPGYGAVHSATHTDAGGTQQFYRVRVD